MDPDKQTKYDESNPYVLPSAKRKTKVIKEKERCTKILSKQQRKKLEKIIEVKKKKANVRHIFTPRGGRLKWAY